MVRNCQPAHCDDVDVDRGDDGVCVCVHCQALRATATKAATETHNQIILSWKFVFITHYYTFISAYKFSSAFFVVVLLFTDQSVCACVLKSICACKHEYLKIRK